MPFELRYHPAIADEDIPRIPQNLHRRIAGAIESRLTQAPHQYGAPLRKTLKGYWKLRVGDYRVVYKIEENEVWILAIRHRKTVYEDILQRLGGASNEGLLRGNRCVLAHRGWVGENIRVARATEVGVLALPLVSLESERIGGRWTRNAFGSPKRSTVFVAIRGSQR